MAVISAGGDHVRIGDGDVIQFEPDDRVGAAVESAAEGGPLHLGLAQGAVGEQQFCCARHGD
jgi:hypothetical protein